MNRTGGCLQRMKEGSAAFTPKERVLAEFILRDPSHAANLSMDDMAMESGVSLSTVVRFCRSLGLSGYKDLVKNLYADLPALESRFEDVRPGADPVTVMHNVAKSSMDAIANTQSINEEGMLLSAVAALSSANRVDFYGMGTSGLVALDGANKFFRIGKTCVTGRDAHNAVLSALSLKPGDAALLISYSGETADILRIAQVVKNSGAVLISLTRYGKNPLASQADIRLYSASNETMLRSGAMSSRIAQMFMIDVLYASVCSQDYDTIREELEQSRQEVMKLRSTP